jgi:hypothetical protein
MGDGMKTKMLLYVISTILTTAASFALFVLGWSYDVNGYGLHPMVSYPFGTLILISPIAAVMTEE